MNTRSRVMGTLRGSFACAWVLAATGCGGSTAGDAAGPQDAVSPADVTAADAQSLDAATTPCGPTGAYGTFTAVQGGQSGVMACGRTLSAFSGATLTLAAADAGTGVLTVTGTGSAGDTTGCAATVRECMVTAVCEVPGGGAPTQNTVTYTLTMFAHSFTGTASLSLPGPGGGCVFPYSISGQR